VCVFYAHAYGGGCVTYLGGLFLCFCGGDGASSVDCDTSRQYI